MIRRRFLDLTRRAFSGAIFACALGVKVETWKLEEGFAFEDLDRIGTERRHWLDDAHWLWE